MINLKDLFNTRKANKRANTWENKYNALNDSQLDRSNQLIEAQQRVINLIDEIKDKDLIIKQLKKEKAELKKVN